MTGDKNKQTEPVCRFGPGGEFVSIWPESSKLQPPSLEAQCAFKDAGTKKHAHQLSTVFSRGDSSLKELRLFPDDDQIGLKTACKPRLRTGARRRTTEKRLRVDTTEQNLLFTSDVRVARTA
jgi:hypothetical protein